MKPLTGLRFAKLMLLGALGRKRAMAESFMRMALDESTGASGLDKFDAETREIVLANGDGIWAELQAGTGEELALAEIAALRVPITLIVGGVSAQFLLDASERLIRGVPSLRVERVPEAGHAMLLDRAEQFATLVEKAIA
jgi:pimeloyl-ACP methyl ester carboxylesterase